MYVYQPFFAGPYFTGTYFAGPYFAGPYFAGPLTLVLVMLAPKIWLWHVRLSVKRAHVLINFKVNKHVLIFTIICYSFSKLPYQRRTQTQNSNEFIGTVEYGW